ncbi:MAG: GDSL-type esterase/lipase family protein [Bacteroidota bacterium]
MKNIIKILSVIIFSSVLMHAQFNQIRVACIGNSITYGGLGAQSYPQQLDTLLGPHYNVKNFGVSGTTMLKHGDFPYWEEESFYNALDLDPHIVIIKLGTNDSKPQNWIYKEEYFPDYIDMINEFRKDGKDPQIFVCYPCPVFRDGYGITSSIVQNEIIPLIDSVRSTTNTFLIDFNNTMMGSSTLFPDGIHPNAQGYNMMAQIARNTILNSASGFILDFYAKDDTFEQGEAITLYWETTAGSMVTLNEQVFADVDSTNVYPTQTQTYMLIASGELRDTAYVTVTYLPSGKIKSFIAEPPMIEKDANETSRLSWSATNGSSVTLDGSTVSQSGFVDVSPDVTTTYKLISTGDSSEEKEITVQVLEPEQINRALNYPATASSTLRASNTQYVNDGDTMTNWISGKTGTQWIYIDLEKTLQINRIVLKWGKVFGVNYRLEVMTESGATTKVFSTVVGDGGIDDISGLTQNGRYVRLLCIGSNMPDSNYTVAEFEVYGTLKPFTDISEPAESIPQNFSLEQNYPNPFNPSTTIEYNITNVETTRRVVFTTLKVYDVLGREIATLVNEQQSPGKYSVKFDVGANHRFALQSGIYFYTLSIKNSSSNTVFQETKKMLLLK